MKRRYAHDQQVKDDEVVHARALNIKRLINNLSENHYDKLTREDEADLKAAVAIRTP